MRHARPDYDRIQDPAVHDPSLLGPGCSPIGEDEPVFLIRAKDALGAEIVLEWATRYGATEGASQATADRVRAFADEMRAWGREHGTKVPDCPFDPDEVPALRYGQRVIVPDGRAGTVRGTSGDVPDEPSGLFRIELDGGEGFMYVEPDDVSPEVVGVPLGGELPADGVAIDSEDDRPQAQA